MSSDQEFFTPYTQQRPLVAGWYEWRVPSQVLSGMNVVVRAKMRMRGAGYDSVLSPSFDHWTGYVVIVPEGTCWRTYDGADKTTRFEVVGIEGLEILPCPFCLRKPVFEGWTRSSDGGIFVGDDPHRYNAWRMNCCEWGRSPLCQDPRVMEKYRREAFDRIAKRRVGFALGGEKC